MSVATTIETKLRDALAPAQLHVVDDSGRHAGHAGARPGGESHFNVEVVAAAFAGKSRLERQRWVHQILAEELAGPVHALSLRLFTPEEATRLAPQASTR
jgi:BolA protein